MLRLQKRLNNFSLTAWAAFIFLVFGLGIVVGGYVFTQHPRNEKVFVEQVYSNFGIELISIALTVLVIEELNKRQTKEEVNRDRVRELILQLGSPDNAFAIEATRILRARGNLTDGTLKGAILLGANLRYADLEGINLQDADMASANLENARMGEANLRGIRLVEANLANASIWEANLENTDLRSANLQASNLRLSNLQNARLDRANLKDADLRATILRGANLTDANLENAVLNNSHFDETTILPDGTKWAPKIYLDRFTDTSHPRFWRSPNSTSPAYQDKDIPKD